MHSAALGRILSPRRISLNCGGSYYITRNGGDKTSFFFRWWLPPVEIGGRGELHPKSRIATKMHHGSVRAVWCLSGPAKNRTRIVGREWLTLKYYHPPLEIFLLLAITGPLWTGKHSTEIARRPTGAEESLWAFWIILLHCNFWFIVKKKRR